MIQYADDRLKSDVIFIWKTCFPDDPESFVKFYFEKVYKNENTLVYIHNQHVVACLQMIPYEMSFYNATIKVRYISGCATLPEFQHQGIMRKLLTFAFEEMKKADIIATILIPQDENVVRLYEKLGYATVFDYQERTVIPKKNTPINKEVSIISVSENSQYLEHAYNYLHLKEKQQTHCVQHTFSDFKNIIADYNLAFGEIWVAIQNNRIVGICFLVENGAFVKEMWTDNQQIEECFLSNITQRFNPSKVVIKQKAENDNLFITKGMARLIQPFEALKIFSEFYPEETCFFEISDEQLPKNNQKICVEKGSCKTVNQFHQENILMLTIKELSLILFRNKLNSLGFGETQEIQPYMNLMLD